MLHMLLRDFAVRIVVGVPNIAVTNFGHIALRYDDEDIFTSIEIEDANLLRHRRDLCRCHLILI